MSELYGYQQKFEDDIGAAFDAGARNVLGVLPTGGGKTVCFSHRLKAHRGHSCAIAHRQELVGQISLSLAREGVRHQIIAPRAQVKLCMQIHREELGVSFYDPAARTAVAGVRTLVRRADVLAGWLQQVSFWVMDEAHHVIRGNTWGDAVDLFPNARGLGVTATPERADGKGLGSHADGVFDVLVDGPGMRELIDQGYLTDYEVWVPPSDLDLSGVNVGATGDFVAPQVAAAVKRSHIVGDVVKHYLKRAPGKLGITFAVDVEAAHELAVAYNAAGVAAAVVSAKTPERDRHAIVRRFRQGILKQLVNVDIFGEGFDLPAIEVVSFARPTFSRNLFVQQFGRGLRLMHPGKVATIIDHVGNIQRHNGPPDIPRTWTLDRRPKRRKGERDPDVIPSRTCIECTRPYPADLIACPYCTAPWVPADRSGPQQVEGDLVQLDRAALEVLYGAVRKVDLSPERVLERMRYAGHSDLVAASAAKNQRRRLAAQHTLRSLMASWGAGQPDREAQKRFWYRYGVDVVSAQALGRADAEQLASRLIDDQ